MTRIVAGRYGGRRIAAPPGRDTRPTSDRVREALFGSLGPLDGVRFLDLYAGSGAIGLEAASRGAAHVLLVESDPKAARVARENVALLGAVRQVTMAVARVAPTLAGGPPGAPYDVVFADPPYAVAEEEIAELLTSLVEHSWLTPEATVVIERSRRSPEPAWVPCITGDRSRRYGDTTLWYGRGS
ncbi:16S rRNA (guanine(966)-N(2))-methyltransferase RsmD [Rugosimonospora acidiphila]|uniref:16S rRNA (Guanine(966)-N(2))-methyltransferase RsmD n=1 Tax=Rugosimonospora acidiphila TaxID=556531 RepID=A0ABP9RPR9_9ACTN